MNSEVFYLYSEVFIPLWVFYVLDCKQFQGKKLYFIVYMLCGIMYKFPLGLNLTFSNMWQILHKW